MPRTASGPHLWLRKERRDKRTGRVTHNAVWLIIDGKAQESTECGRADRDGAQRALERYLNLQHADIAAKPSPCPRPHAGADVLALYADASLHNRRPPETDGGSRRSAFFTDKGLADIDGELCRDMSIGLARTERGASI